VYVVAVQDDWVCNSRLKDPPAVPTMVNCSALYWFVVAASHGNVS
jgi:hypothetical protein